MNSLEFILIELTRLVGEELVDLVSVGLGILHQLLEILSTELSLQLVHRNLIRLCLMYSIDAHIDIFNLALCLFDDHTDIVGLDLLVVWVYANVSHYNN